MARTPTRLLALAAVASAVVGIAATPAQADTSTIKVVASGLDSPRLLSFSPTGQLYVAEAGRGGAAPCAEQPELGRLCFGSSGAITRVNPHGPDKRVVTGLPSIASTEDALGPMDVEFTGGNKYVVSIGLGAHPDFRDNFGKPGALLGTLVTGKLSHPGFSLFADVAANEAATNPDGTDLDSNPTGIFRTGNGYYVADAGGNAVVRASRQGFSTLAVLPPGSALAPPFLGLPPGTQIPTDAVPTSVVRGPDGAYYISQLTGFPFEKGDSAIWRVVPGSQPTRWATGLTNVTDLAFSRSGQLYAVQISAEGLLNGPVGSLVRVTPGGSSHHTVAGGLFAPYGLALAGHVAYVSTCSVCIGNGQVVRIPLH